MSKANNRGTKINDLRDLGTHFAHLKSQLPTIGELKREFSGLDEMVEQKVKLVERVEQGVADIIESQKAAKSWLAGKEGLALKIARQHLAQHMDDAERYLKEYFEIEDPIF